MYIGSDRGVLESMGGVILGVICRVLVLRIPLLSKVNVKITSQIQEWYKIQKVVLLLALIMKDSRRLE